MACSVFRTSDRGPAGAHAVERRKGTGPPAAPAAAGAADKVTSSLQCSET